MGFITGLANAQAKTTKPERVERVKNEWASLKSDGDSSKVIPLQELDEGSPNYNEKLGLAVFALEHSNPDDFKKNALCTQEEEGACYGCEQGWYQKVVLYINVLFDVGTKDERVAVLSKGTGKGSVGKEILSIAADDDYNNSITDKLFKFSRSGKGTDTSYGFSFMKAHDKNLEDYADKLYDLKAVPFRVDYARQEAYYTGGAAAPERKEATEKSDAPQSAASVDNDW